MDIALTGQPDWLFLIASTYSPEPVLMKMAIRFGVDSEENCWITSRNRPGMMTTYREIEVGDLPAIFDVRIKTWHNPNGAEELEQMGITPDSVQEMMSKTHRGWLAESEGRIVGFVMGNGRTGEVWVIAVLAEFENQGIGKSLMSLIEDWLISVGCQALWLTTDPDESFRAVGFYKHLGWRDWKFEGGDRFMKKQNLK